MPVRKRNEREGRERKNWQGRGSGRQVDKAKVTWTSFVFHQGTFLSAEDGDGGGRKLSICLKGSKNEKPWMSRKRRICIK